MNVIINPGTGPVKNASYKNAEKNLDRLIQDTGIARNTLRIKSDCKENDGRFMFFVQNNDVVCSVDMPGISIEKVRYVDDPGQNIWDFPRLYVNGSSWSWCYAVGKVAETLAP